MKALLCLLFAVLPVVAGSPCSAQSSSVPGAAGDEFLTWSAKRAKTMALSTRVNGQVGKSLDFRGFHTERSYNFKLRATWLTPEVIRARARLVQLAERLSNDAARALVVEADSAAMNIVLVEIDPREGSGVIPLDWIAFLQPRGTASEDRGSVKGTITPSLGDLKALTGGLRRDYAYDSFWMTFPLPMEHEEWTASQRETEIELIVGIQGKVGKVHWPVPASVRERWTR